MPAENTSGVTDSARNGPPSQDTGPSNEIGEAVLDAAKDPGLREDLALSLLKRSDLSAEVLESLSKNTATTKSRKVRIALVGHPKTPRHISLPLLRHLFTFDLMQIALAPAIPADVKMAADESLINHLESTSQGERLSLARRGSGRIAGALLLDPETRVLQAALENSRLTESAIIKALMRRDASAAFVQAVCHHARWSARREIRMALLRSQDVPMAKAIEFARGIPLPMLKEILQISRLPPNTKSYLLKDLSGPNSAAQK